MGYILTDTSPAYELVQDITVSSATTSVSFTGLNFTSADDYLLVSDIGNASASATTVYIYKNGDTTNTNYYRQLLWSTGTSVLGDRQNYPQIAESAGSARNVINSKIKLTNSNYFTVQSDHSSYVGSISELRKYNTTSTNTLTSITSLTIQTAVANAIAVGSRFRLYKLVAEKVADITISTATTSVDITGLSIDKGSEYMLVADGTNTTGTNTVYKLYANGNYTDTNYWSQELQVLGSGVYGARVNRNLISYVANNTKTLAICNIKLSNNNTFISQSSTVDTYGGSSVSLVNSNGTSTFTMSSITDLRISAQVTNGIGVGSRFQLYKLR